MEKPRYNGLVGHRPRHVYITADLVRCELRPKTWLFSRPDTQEHGRLGAKDASELTQCGESIRLKRQVMQDRNAQACVERRVTERQFRRFASDPIDAHGFRGSSFACAPSHQEGQ